MTDNLFQPYRLNDTISLNNRILMAPLTRCMATDELVPTQQMADYYAKRAQAGLIISEAVNIRPDAIGYGNSPGLYTPEQIQGWKSVTKSVHDKDGKIFAQLWHTGRVAHSFFFGGTPIAPSAIGLQGQVPRNRELSYETPKEATQQDIKQLIEDYAQAAANAIEAGFDGVEIHGANGYLIDQFLHHDSNRRQDEYGQSPENMARFPLAVVDAICARIGNDRTALRISPGAYFNIETDAKDRLVFDYLLPQLEKRQLAFLHLGIFDDSLTFDYLGGQASAYIRQNYQQTFVNVGSYNATTASQAISEDKFDLIAIGRAFIANPDYVERVKAGKPVVEYHTDMLKDLI
jgi:2,4-dienoyl-CoA reductase-like NADH-dependent reductase (Old Yellow Enzyme family)